MVHRLPESVEIGPYRYRFLRTDEADADHRWAFVSYSRHLIGFGLLCNEREMPNSLVHELLHTVADAYGVELEEGQVKALANGLTQALTNLELLPQTMCLKDENTRVTHGN